MGIRSPQHKRRRYMPRKYPRHGFYFLRSREEEEKMKQESEQAGFYPFLPLRVYAIGTGYDCDYDMLRVIFCRIPALRVPRVYAECLLRYLCVRLNKKKIEKIRSFICQKNLKKGFTR